jgi:hypothetical protein
MTMRDPRIIYGIHQITPYSRTTGLPYGTSLVLANSSIAFAGSLKEQFGGSARFPWAVEEATISTDIKIAVKSLENWMFEIFLGKSPTHTTTPDTNGVISGIANKKGTSMVAATGLASVSMKTANEANLKFGKYVVKAVNATTVDVYCLTNADFNKGTDLAYQDNLCKITASPLTITTGAAVEIPNTGLELTGGAGTIALTTDDTATFEVLPVFSEELHVTIGGVSDTFPEFGMIMVAQMRGNGELFEIDAYRVKAVGLPIGLAEKAFGESEINAKAFYDSALSGVCGIRWMKP